MGKLACRCGNVISGVVCPNPAWGHLTGQEDGDRVGLGGEAGEAVAAFVAALVAGRREEWIRGYFLKEYPSDIPDQDVIFDIVLGFDLKYHKKVAECDRCGRLWARVRAGANEYRSYVPDEGGYAGVLRGGVGGGNGGK